MKRSTQSSPHSDEIAALLPAYALEALPLSECARVEAHLNTCAECRALLADYRTIADGLPYTAPRSSAPAHLEADLIRRLNTPVRRPVAVQPRPRWWAQLAELFRATSRPAFTLVALVAAVLVMTNLYWLGALNQMRAEQGALAAQVEANAIALHALAAGGRAITLHGGAAAPESAGLLVLTADNTQAILMAEGLPPAPAGSVYQLWLIHDGQRDSGGLFTVDAHGRGALVVNAPGPLTSYQAVGVTLEPGGGSSAPTTPQSLGSDL